MNSQMRDFRLKIKYDYAAWANQILQGQYDDKEWKGYFVSFMFHHVHGSIEQKYMIMEDDIDRVYATLVRHVVHNGRSKAQREKLPILYAFPDYPRYKLFPFRIEDIKINGGLHYHGIFLIRTDTKLEVPLDFYIDENREHFEKPSKPLRRIWIGPIDRTPDKAVAYALKSLETRIPDSNRMLILPKALSELPSKGGKSTDAIAASAFSGL